MTHCCTKWCMSAYHTNLPLFLLKLGFMKTLLGVKFLILFAFAMAAFGQSTPDGFKSQEVSETDGIPVLVKHLPEWESVRSSARLTNDIADLKRTLGDRPILSSLDLSGGAEAVTADYRAGKLLIVEFPTPHASVAADAEINQRLAESPDIVYRRIGNYNAFVFDAATPESANGLLDQVKYEKSVQWLGEDPFLLQKIQRYMVGTSADMMIATVVFIVLGLGGSIFAGIGIGYAYFRFREQKRAERHAFSDAGGLTRLNLDELSE